MNVDITERPLIEQIKFAVSFRGYTIKTFGEEFNRRRETKYSPPSFSRKLNNGNFNFEELKTISEILGFKVKLELVE